MVNFNGALVHIPNQYWAHEKETSIDKRIVFEILAQKRQLNLDFIAAENRETYFIDVRTWGGPMAILEIVSKGIEKAKGVHRIANYLDIDQKDVIAFGDEHNDLELLEYAGWGVAMKNGTDQLKGVANDVTEHTNQEDGLATYLEDLLAL